MTNEQFEKERNNLRIQEAYLDRAARIAMTELRCMELNGEGYTDTGIKQVADAAIKLVVKHNSDAQIMKDGGFLSGQLERKYLRGETSKFLDNALVSNQR